MRSLHIVGAGAVGLCLAARVARSGGAVSIVTRRPEAARRLREAGLTAEDAATGATFRVSVSASDSLDALPRDDTPLCICTRREDAAELAPRLAQAGPNRTVVTFQNDVVSEEAVGRHLGSVIGAVWRETCTRLADDRVRFQIEKPGRAVLGRHPVGATSDPQLDALAELLRKGSIDVGISPRIADDKWLKLCVNLTSAPNALVRQEDHGSPAFVAIKVQLLEEARAALAAAGIIASSCDGRDRSLEAEIANHRESLERGSSARSIPLYNQVWASLKGGAPPEADAYHLRILELARAHNLAAPMNARVLERLQHAFATGSGPECLGAEELLGH